MSFSDTIKIVNPYMRGINDTIVATTPVNPEATIVA